MEQALFTAFSGLRTYMTEKSIMSVFRAKPKKTFFFTQNCKRHNARYSILSVMKEHLSNPPSIRLDYHLLVFSFRFLLSKLAVCDIEKAHFQICIQSWSARMRVHHLKVTCV